MIYGDYYPKGHILKRPNRYYFQPKARGRGKRKEKNHTFVEFCVPDQCFIYIISFNADKKRKSKTSLSPLYK